MKARAIVLLAALFGAGLCSVRAYSVEPRTAQQSGWTHGEDGYVSQTVTCCWDSLERVELFAGAVGDSGAYTATVYEGGMQLMSSPGDGTPEHGWVKFYQWDDTVAFTKGKQITVKFTRGGSDHWA